MQQDTLFSTVIPEGRVPGDHPLCPIREMVNAALKELDADFNALYSAMGRDSIPPEKLLRAQLLMAFYTIRSERTFWPDYRRYGNSPQKSATGFFPFTLIGA